MVPAFQRKELKSLKCWKSRSRTWPGNRSHSRETCCMGPSRGRREARQLCMWSKGCNPQARMSQLWAALPLTAYLGNATFWLNYVAPLTLPPGWQPVSLLCVCHPADSLSHSSVAFSDICSQHISHHHWMCCSQQGPKLSVKKSKRCVRKYFLHLPVYFSFPAFLSPLCRSRFPSG